MPAAAGREKPHPLLAQGFQGPVGGGQIAKAVATEHLADGVGARIGIEHEIHFGLRRRVGGKGVVQQMVEDPAVDVGRLGEIPAESIAGRRAGAVAAAGGEPGGFEIVTRHDVGLPVVEHLEPMLDRPQERVGSLQDLPFLVGQAAGRREPPDRFERVRGANFWRVAAGE